jgi:hypothetical protein
MMKQIKGFDVTIINTIIGVLAAFMIFLPILILKDSESAFTGIEIVFGKDLIDLGALGSGQINMNPLILLAFLMPLLGAMMPLFFKQGYMISTLLYIVSAILMFMIPQTTLVSISILGNTNDIDVSWTYGIGLILGALFSILGAILCGYKILKDE